MKNKNILIIVVVALFVWWMYSSYCQQSIEGIGFPMGTYQDNWKHGYQFQSPFYGFNSNDPAYYQRQYTWY
jgi:hypothetical protein